MLREREEISGQARAACMNETSAQKLVFGFRSDVGRVRQVNEDSFLVLTGPHLPGGLDAVCAVADGMGGHQAGEVASSTVVSLLEEWFTSGSYLQQVTYSPTHRDYYLVVLKEVLERLNDEVCQLAAQRDGTSGMGTTATLALVQGDCLYIGHVGDSRAYLLRGDTLHRLTQDHTWVAEQMQAGYLSAAEAATHPRRHVLTRAVGHSATLRADRAVYSLQLGDRVLLCSDGLSGVVAEDVICQTLRNAPNPQVACDQLADLANQQGGPDNISAVAFYVVSSGPSHTSLPARVLGPAKRQPAATAAAPDQTQPRLFSVPKPSVARVARASSWRWPVLVFAATFAAGSLALLLSQLFEQLGWLAVVAVALAGLGMIGALGILVRRYRAFLERARDR